jgi:hypothetical protein
MGHAPDHAVISSWEHARHRPSHAHRIALRDVASKCGHSDLVKIFEAPPAQWEFASLVLDLLFKGDE